MHSLPPLKIRPGRLRDVPVISRFNAALARETEHRRLPSARLRAGVGALIRDPAKGTYWVATVGSRVVGQCLITFEWSDWRNGSFWWFQSVYVNRAHRGQGVFKALFQHVQSLARARGNVCGLRLYMERDNAPARQTYTRLGMKPTTYEVFEQDFVLPTH